MTSIATLILLSAVLAGLPGCGGNPSNWTDADAGPADAGPVPPPPGALILSAGGSLTGGAYRLEVQVGQVVVPQSTRAGDTQLAPDNPIDR